MMAGKVFRRLLIVGDSISCHGPAPHLGWTGDWGMAASREEDDYVHRFRWRLAENQEGVVPELLVWAKGGGTLAGQQEFLSCFAAFAPDLAVIQMGENDNRDVHEKGFQKPYELILRAIRQASPEAVILCLGVWSPPSGSPVKDRMIRAASEKYGALFVDLQEANVDPANMAASEGRFSHQGVAWHPGDAGMRAYADALWTVLANPARAALPARAGETLAEEIVFHETWTRGILEVSGEDPPHEKFLPITRLRGRHIMVETRVKSSALALAPEHPGGVKLCLALHDAEGGNELVRINIPAGSLDWHEVAWPFRVPDNIVEASLVLGLENAPGRAWFGELKITRMPVR